MVACNQEQTGIKGVRGENGWREVATGWRDALGFRRDFHGSQQTPICAERLNNSDNQPTRSFKHPTTQRFLLVGAVSPVNFDVVEAAQLPGNPRHQHRLHILILTVNIPSLGLGGFRV